MAEKIGMLSWLERAQKASQAIQATGGRLAGKLTKAAGVAACNAAGSNPGQWILNSAGKAYFDEVCGQHWADNGWAPPTASPPFEGGQCPGQLYIVNAVVSYQPSGFPPTSNPITTGTSRRITGPVTGVEVRDALTDWVVFAVGATERVMIFQSGGNDVIFPKTSVPGRPSISGISVSPITPECGNPDPVITPYTGPSTPYGSPTVINIDGDEYNITPIQPEIDIDGTISIPVDIDGTLFDLTGEDSGTPYTGDGPAQPGDEQPGSNSPEDPGSPDDFPNPPPGREWAGAVVRLTALPPGTGGIPQSEPNTIFPRVMGNARLRMRLDDGTIVLGEPIQIKAKDELLWRPSEGLEVIGVFCNVVPLADYSVTPLSIPIPGEDEPIPIGV